LLQFGEFVFELVFIDAFGADTRGYGGADFLANGVLFAESFPVVDS
jgi:hypothetical protein